MVRRIIDALNGVRQHTPFDEINEDEQQLGGDWCEGSCIVNVCFGRKSAANLCDLYLILINHSPHLHNPHDQLLATSVLARGIN